MTTVGTQPVQSFDYLIVGGGSAGCVLAARLSENPGVRVALLEAGPPDHSVLIHCPAGLAVLAKNGQANWAFDTVPQLYHACEQVRDAGFTQWDALTPFPIDWAVKARLRPRVIFGGSVG